MLYGGTAIALHLGHRESLDFDFFGNKPLDPTRLVPAIPFLANATVTQREPNTFSCHVDRGGVVKLFFFGLPGIPRLSPRLIAPDNGLQVASLLDLAGSKASVVQQCAEAKDYIDIDALLTGGKLGLPTALAAARAMHEIGFNPQSTLDHDVFGWNSPKDMNVIAFNMIEHDAARKPVPTFRHHALKALCYFEDGNLRRLPQPVKDRLVKAVRDVDLDHLPAIAVSGGVAHHGRGLTS